MLQRLGGQGTVGGGCGRGGVEGSLAAVHRPAGGGL